MIKSYKEKDFVISGSGTKQLYILKIKKIADKEIQFQPILFIWKDKSRLYKKIKAKIFIKARDISIESIVSRIVFLQC